MITISNKIDQSLSDYNKKILRIISNNIDEIIFFDIETTGFSRDYNICYLIGVVYFNDEIPHYIQWLAETEKDEANVLNAFNNFSKKYSKLIHFNGEAFDIPFITARAKNLNISLDLSHMASLDLLNMIRSCKPILKLENYKQKTIEHFLNIERDDKYSGGELIEVFKHFSKSKNENDKELLLLHNHDDIIGMIDLLPIISYYAISQLSFSYDHSEIAGNNSDTLEIYFLLGIEIPVNLSINYGLYSVIISTNHLMISIPLRNGELKHFYPNYKDYYYLESEDKAIHKSVAEFVDKNYRTKATAANCYIKKNSSFLYEPEELFTPTFKESNKDSHCFFELNAGFLSNNDSVIKYSNMILKHLFKK